MGNKPSVSLLTTGSGLTEKERKLIKGNWLKLMKNEPDVFTRAWKNAAIQNKGVAAAFGLTEHEDPDKSEKFQRQTEAVDNFFHHIVVNDKLVEGDIRNDCFDLGKNHSNYVASGFQAVYWNIFSDCLISSIDEANFGVTGKKRDHLMAAWKKLIIGLIEFTKQGYVDGYFIRKVSGCPLNKKIPFEPISKTSIKKKSN